MRDPISGLVTADKSDRQWEYIKRKPPATGSRRIEHPPENSNITAEQPFPCPIGYYCQGGAVTDQPLYANFSTPQKCFDGFFCPRGSSTPEGKGPCPTGHYCPSDTLAVKCERGHYCPGVGNTKPLPCYPGTYAPNETQSSCVLCEKGEICPGWNRTEPLPCPAGFVCDSSGLSEPNVLCPNGYYCDEGTTTRDPLGYGKPPRPCPPGVFCLAGVAHNITIEWVPSVEEGKWSPQPCSEGYFCEEASSLPRGSGPCFEGHYCPPGTDYPVEVPVGSFSKNQGSIVPTLCFPGTYSPRRGSIECRVCPAGFTCQGYGTYVPKICRAGTYRSLADSVTCKLCPTGTFSPFQGISNIGECFPCPSGRVCGVLGMTDLKDSEPCPGGYICGSGTDRTRQYLHKCPAGK